MMLTNAQIDDRLIDEAKQLGGHQSEWETVNNALREYVQKRRGFLAKPFRDFNAYPKSDDMGKQAKSPDELLRELRNSVTEYKKPTDPVGLDD